MLPAPELLEIFTNLAALNLQPDTAAAVLGAVLAPLMRTETGTIVPVSERPRRRGGRPRARLRKGRGGRKRRKYRRTAQSADARERARAALKANPGATVSAVAKAAGVSYGTIINARKDLAKEARKEARRKSRTTETTKSSPATSPKRERAQKWLRDTLAQGPKEVQAIEAAAAKAHIDDVVLTQARGDLGVIATRADSGGVHAVQWALPG